jgi:hypothetical protein
MPRRQMDPEAAITLGVLGCLLGMLALVVLVSAASCAGLVPGAQ